MSSGWVWTSGCRFERAASGVDVGLWLRRADLPWQLKHRRLAGVLLLSPMRCLYRFVPLPLLLLLGGCLHVKMDPIQVHSTVDVNVRVERALDDFFGELDAQSKTLRR